jgi:hypothetical protein
MRGLFTVDRHSSYIMWNLGGSAGKRYQAQKAERQKEFE